MTKVIFASKNPFKALELIPLAGDKGIELVHMNVVINELQTMDVSALIRDKTLKAFDCLRSPVIVDHASLAIECLGDMPGNLTQLFWDNLGEKICSIVHSCNYPNARATATTTLGYCDGQKIYTESASQMGRISTEPRGQREFQWDTIFVPDGYKLTFAQMNVTSKNAFSSRSVAFEKLISTIYRRRN